MHERPVDAIGWGLYLHRYHDHREWPRLLETMVPAEHRAGAEEYLRGIAARMRVVRQLRKSVPERRPRRREPVE
jgi:hypothetical protein